MIRRSPVKGVMACNNTRVVIVPFPSPGGQFDCSQAYDGPRGFCVQLRTPQDVQLAGYLRPLARVVVGRFAVQKHEYLHVVMSFCPLRRTAGNGPSLVESSSHWLIGSSLCPLPVSQGKGLQ